MSSKEGKEERERERRRQQTGFGAGTGTENVNGNGRTTQQGSFNVPAYLTAIGAASSFPAARAEQNLANISNNSNSSLADATTVNATTTNAESILDLYGGSPLSRPQSPLLLPKSAQSPKQSQAQLQLSPQQVFSPPKYHQQYPNFLNMFQSQINTQKMHGLQRSSSVSAFSSVFSRPYQSGSQAPFSTNDNSSQLGERANSAAEYSSNNSIESGSVDDAEIIEYDHYQNQTDLNVTQIDSPISPETESDIRGRAKIVQSKEIPKTNQNLNNFYPVNDDDDDDDAPLGIVAAQFRNQQVRQHRSLPPISSVAQISDRSQISPQPQSTRHRFFSSTEPPQLTQQQKLQDILSSIASTSKALDEPSNNTNDLSNLEGLVGQLDKLIKSRKETTIRIANTDLPTPPVPAHKNSIGSAITSTPLGRSVILSPDKLVQSDSEDDEVPLARIHSKSLDDTGIAAAAAAANARSKSVVSRGTVTPNKTAASKDQQQLPRRPSIGAISPKTQKPEPAFSLPPTQTQTLPSQIVMPVVKKVTTRIYIDSQTAYKTVILTNLLSADAVIHELLAIIGEKNGGSGIIDDGTWTLFEVCHDFGVERPLRDWEIVTDILAAWDPTASANMLILKSYTFRNTLIPRSIIGKWPKVDGRCDMEIKPGKFRKRHILLREDSIYYREFDREIWLCKLNNFDVYTLITPRKRATTNYCFALRSTKDLTFFENADEYIHFFCVENKDLLADWVLGIRLAKSEATFAEYPDMFVDYDQIPARSQPPLRQPLSNGAAASASTPGRLLVGDLAADSPAIANLSLLGRSMSKKETIQPQQQPQQSTVTPNTPTTQSQNQQKPLLTFPNQPQMARQQTGKRTAPAATVANPPIGVTLLFQQQQQQQAYQDAAAADAAIFEACDMPLSVLPTRIEAYDEAQLREIQARLDRAWEYEQQQTLADIERIKSGGGGSGSGSGGGDIGNEAVQQQQAPAMQQAAVPLLQQVPPLMQKSRSKKTAANGGGGGASRNKAGPLVDIGDVRNCATCGCSEFKTIFGQAGVVMKDGRKVCGNCRHATHYGIK